ncbi:hypothetical protein ACYE2N_06775 [Flavobacterium sp. MAHUQ-51]|uniref:hypothetical protein n=1 Tax=Flavobacterium sp. GCM10022190 TaxID=3252639 RepID=UPI00361EB4A7
MKKYLTIFILSLGLNSIGQNCSMLVNGEYETQYDDKDWSSYRFEIKGNHYYTFDEKVKKDYEIVLLSKCSFILESVEKLDESKLTEFQKVISKQKPYFEITKVEGNIYYFICRVDLHVQCGTGKFIKKEK